MQREGGELSGFVERGRRGVSCRQVRVVRDRERQRYIEEIKMERNKDREEQRLKDRVIKDSERDNERQVDICIEEDVGVVF